MSGWTDERVEALKAMWSDGLSMGQIAKALGGCTRNAVIGKVHRLGLSSRARQASAPKLRAPVIRVQAAPKPPPAPPPAPRPERAPTTSVRLRATAPDVPRPPPRTVDAVGLREPCAGHCRWPIGDPRDATFGFCGQPSRERTYCAAHAARAVKLDPNPVSERSLRWVLSRDYAPARRSRDPGPWKDAA